MCIDFYHFLCDTFDKCFLKVQIYKIYRFNVVPTWNVYLLTILQKGFVLEKYLHQYV